MSEMDVSEKLGRAHAIFEGLCREQTRGENGKSIGKGESKVPGLPGHAPCSHRKRSVLVCWPPPSYEPNERHEHDHEPFESNPQINPRFLSRCIFAAPRKIAISSGHFSVSTRRFLPSCRPAAVTVDLTKQPWSLAPAPPNGFGSAAQPSQRSPPSLVGQSTI